MGVWTSTPHDATAAAVLTAAQWDATVRDGFNAFGAMTSYGSGSDWTAATTNPSLGNGTWDAAYTRIQSMVWFRIHITMGSTTTYGTGSFRFNLPATAADVLSGAGGAIGSAALYDTSGAARKFRHVYLAASTYVALADDDGATVASTVPWTWATGDTIAIRGWYVAA